MDARLVELFECARDGVGDDGGEHSRSARLRFRRPARRSRRREAHIERRPVDPLGHEEARARVEQRRAPSAADAGEEERLAQASSRVAASFATFRAATCRPIACGAPARRPRWPPPRPARGSCQTPRAAPRARRERRGARRGASVPTAVP